MYNTIHTEHSLVVVNFFNLLNIKSVVVKHASQSQTTHKSQWSLLAMYVCKLVSSHQNPRPNHVQLVTQIDACKARLSCIRLSCIEKQDDSWFKPLQKFPTDFALYGKRIWAEGGWVRD